MNEFKDRQFVIPASFQDVTGCLRKVTVKTATKILEEAGDAEDVKKAAQDELARLVSAIERVAQPMISSLTKLADGAKQYQLEFYVEHGDAFKDEATAKSALNVPTVANHATTFDVDVVLGNNIF